MRQSSTPILPPNTLLLAGAVEKPRQTPPCAFTNSKSVWRPKGITSHEALRLALCPYWQSQGARVLRSVVTFALLALLPKRMRIGEGPGRPVRSAPVIFEPRRSGAEKPVNRRKSGLRGLKSGELGGSR